MIFFTPLPVGPVGDSAQEIFVRLVRGYVHSKKAIYPEVVYEKSYMKGRKKGVVLVPYPNP